MNLVLASASPRRAELLRQVGIPFTITIPDVIEEKYNSLAPHEMVVRLSQEKALAVSGPLEEGIILAADTVVLHRGVIMGKPVDQIEALQMLRLLSGDRHSVLTGLTLLDAASGKYESRASITKVWMANLSESDLDAYVATGEPLDKAGAYGIQGRAALFVEKIEGCYFNVVGLPLNLLYNMMKKMQKRRDGDHE